MNKHILTAAILISVLYCGAPAPAQAGILEFFFPMLKKTEPDPSQTLEAPFAEPSEQSKTYGPKPPAEVQPLPENSVALDKPHRSTLQVGAWIAPVVAEAMSFGGADYKTDLAATENYFEKNGRAQYLKFLDDSRISQNLKTGKYNLRAYVRDVPLLLNEGASEGRYHWLYEVPVTVTYMDKNVVDYKKAEPINQMFVLKIQVGRSAEAQNQIGLLVEYWSGKSVKLENP